MDEDTIKLIDDLNSRLNGVIQSLENSLKEVTEILDAYEMRSEMIANVIETYADGNCSADTAIRTIIAVFHETHFGPNVGESEDES